MKLSDVVVGGRYTAKVSGALHVVRVTELKEIPPASWSRSDKWRTLTPICDTVDNVFDIADRVKYHLAPDVLYRATNHSAVAECQSPHLLSRISLRIFARERSVLTD